MTAIRDWLDDRRPKLHIVLAPEDVPKMALDADTFEDEIHLREWLRRSSMLEELPEIAARLLDDVDAQRAA
jgi:hypothetical protein